MPRILYCLLLALVIIGPLSACRQTPSADRPLPQAARPPDPTATPKTTGGPPPTPTSVVSALVATQVYTHTSHRFSITYPTNWQPSSRTDGVVFVEPGDQAGYSVFFNDVGQVYSTKELNQYLVTFVAQNFVGDKSGFKVISQQKQADGSIRAEFTTRDPKLGQMINEVRVTQLDTIVFIVLISATQAQWQVSQTTLEALTGTLTPLDTTPIANTTPTPSSPVWLLIGPTSNRFAFFYSSDWQVTHQDENSVQVAMPDLNFTFEASAFAWPGTDPAAAEKAAQTYLTSLSKKYKDVQNRPAVKFPLDTITDGATIDFLYTAAGNTLAGSVITARRDEQMYRIVFTAPAKFYQDALQWFNPMYKSFKILSPDELIVTPTK